VLLDVLAQLRHADRIAACIVTRAAAAVSVALLFGGISSRAA
jgi:hypothetical protein